MNEKTTNTLVFTATYNEADSASELVDEITKALPDADVLIIDDSSPDGTFALLQDLSQANPRLSVVQRPRKLGIGSAHQLAMQYALHHGYGYLITMDADFSHHPRYLPTMMEMLEKHDFVTGSRYVEGGSSDYTGIRMVMSKLANLLVRHLLGVKLRESTTSFRGFRLDLLRRLEDGSGRPDGYAFFFDGAARVAQHTENAAEFPIHFQDRRFGSSNLSKLEIVRATYVLAKMTLQRIFGRNRAKTQDGLRYDHSCRVCGSNFSTLVYPARKSESGEAEYRCTTSTHRSHPEIRKCLRCGIIFGYPMPGDEELNAIYAEVDDPLYEENLDARRITFDYNWRKVAGLIPQGGRLLEIGSYYGGFLEVAGASGINAKGLEPSKRAVEYCKSKGGLEVEQGFVADLEGRSEEFDCVVAWDVMEHLTDPLEALRVVNSNLRPNGKFVFSTLNVSNWFARLLGKRWPWYVDMHLYYFTSQSIADVLKRTGFRPVFIRPYCHVVTAGYLLEKLESLGVFGAGWLSRRLSGTFLSSVYIPFRFGDIALVCAAKVEDVDG